MDVMLERILSLIPRKPNGDFVHGALKDFAASIGLKSGNVIADWIAGRSKSYQKKLHEISAVYGVSVEWLTGESEQQKKPADQMASGLQDTGYYDLTPENKAVIDDLIAKLLKSQSVE